MPFYDRKTQFFIEHHVGNSILTGKHFHNLYEFYHLEEGCVSYFIDNHIYDLKKGSIVIIPPNTLHKTISVSNSLRKRCLFYLDIKFLYPLAGDELINWSGASIFHAGDQKRLSFLFNELLYEFKNQKNDIYIKALLCELLILLQRTPSLQDNEVDKTPSKIADIMDYINEEYNSDINLKSVAEHFYFNPSYLSRLFQQSTGFKFTEYLNKFRISKANALLIETNKNITEIAMLSGYNSTNHFCKMYKQIMQITPLEYRKYHQLK